MIIKTIAKDGTVKVYEYAKEKQDKYYSNFKTKKGGRCNCQICGKEVYVITLKQHQNSKVCKLKKQLNEISKINNNGSSSNDTNINNNNANN